MWRLSVLGCACVGVRGKYVTIKPVHQQQQQSHTERCFVLLPPMSPKALTHLGHLIHWRECSDVMLHELLSLCLWWYTVVQQ